MFEFLLFLCFFVLDAELAMAIVSEFGSTTRLSVLALALALVFESADAQVEINAFVFIASFTTLSSASMF